jgi:hypothetical protein
MPNISHGCSRKQRNGFRMNPQPRRGCTCCSLNRLHTVLERRWVSALDAWWFTSSWGLACTARFTPALCLSLRSWQCLRLLCFAFLPFAHMPNAVADGSDMLHVLNHCSVLMLRGGRRPAFAPVPHCPWPSYSRHVTCVTSAHSRAVRSLSFIRDALCLTAPFKLVPFPCQSSLASLPGRIYAILLGEAPRKRLAGLLCL